MVTYTPTRPGQTCPYEISFVAHINFSAISRSHGLTKSTPQWKVLQDKSLLLDRETEARDYLLPPAGHADGDRPLQLPRASLNFPIVALMAIDHPQDPTCSNILRSSGEATGDPKTTTKCLWPWRAAYKGRT